MMWSVLISLVQAQEGAGIGILGPVPAEPSSARPTYTRRKGRDMAQVAEPTFLVPVGYLSGKTNDWNRYYDEDGTVYRFREANAILEGAPAAGAHMEKASKHRTRATLMFIAGEVLFPNTLGCCIAGSGMESYGAAEESFRSALTSYNLRDELPVAPVVAPVVAPETEPGT